VHIDVVSWDQYWQKMMTAVVTHTCQDVWLMSPAYVEQYAGAGHLLDLMPFLKADPTFKSDDYFPYAFDAFCFAGPDSIGTIRQVPFGGVPKPGELGLGFPESRLGGPGQGKLYAFTRDYNCSLLFFNRDHFDALGLAYPNENWTWDDLVETAKKLTIDFNGDGVIDQWGYGGLNYRAFLHAIGGQTLDVERHKSTTSTPLVIKSVRFCQDLIYKYRVHPPPAIQVDETESFTTGKISMTVAGVWNIRSYNRSEYLWDIAPIPVDVKGRPHWASVGGVAHCIFARTRHPKEAWRLVKFLSSESSQRELARSGTSVPVLKKAAFSDDFLAPFDRQPKSSYHVIFDGFKGPPSPGTYSKGYLEYTRHTQDILDAVWRNDHTPEEACRMIDRETDAILAEQYGGTP
jgi:multiple sugar transport system substrate-binding protein